MQTAPSTKRSFLELIKENSIVIPHLQRDYAQGRKSQAQKLLKFVEFLKGALENEKAVNLDFVFGYYEQGEIPNSFIPIDGQQRLTTVFLLHWYLAVQSDDYESFSALMINKGELKFTYQTRISSQEFIASLLLHGLECASLISKDKTVSKVIENCGWFYQPWKEDSTVEAMLNALDMIHSVFKGANELKTYYQRLEEDCISFEFLHPEAIELSDEFYIKMNARGLPLTPFENFKGDLLDSLALDYPDKKELFAERLDDVWSDAIWNWSVRAGSTYDSSFMKLFDFMFQVCYSKQRAAEESGEYEMTKDYVNLLSKDSLEYVLKTLDLIVRLDKHFESQEKQIGTIYSVFMKLFSANNLGHPDKLKLYGLLQYQVKYDIKTEADCMFTDFVRVVDNVLINTNQSKKHEFASDLRTSRYKELLEFIDEVMAFQNPYQSLSMMVDKNDVINHEVLKAKKILAVPEIKNELQRLEDHPYLKGCLINFMYFFEKPTFTKHYVDTFYTLWDTNKNNDLMLHRALFSLGDYTVHVGGSGLGGLYYAGRKDRWHRVLANTNKESRDQIVIFSQLFQLLQNTSLQDVFKELETINLPEKTSWRYYLAKYPQVLKGYELFAFNEINVAIARLELLQGAILSTYHTGYLNRAVVLQVRKENQQLAERIESFSNNVSWSTIRIENTTIEFNGNNWKVNTDVNLSSVDKVKITRLEESTNEYLISSSELDLVQQIEILIKRYFFSK